MFPPLFVNLAKLLLVVLALFTVVSLSRPASSQKSTIENRGFSKINLHRRDGDGITLETQPGQKGEQEVNNGASYEYPTRFSEDRKRDITQAITGANMLYETDWQLISAILPREYTPEDIFYVLILIRRQISTILEKAYSILAQTKPRMPRASALLHKIFQSFVQARFVDIGTVTTDMPKLWTTFFYDSPGADRELALAWLFGIDRTQIQEAANLKILHDMTEAFSKRAAGLSQWLEKNPENNVNQNLLTERKGGRIYSSNGDPMKVEADIKEFYVSVYGLLDLYLVAKDNLGFLLEQLKTYHDHGGAERFKGSKPTTKQRSGSPPLRILIEEEPERVVMSQQAPQTNTRTEPQQANAFPIFGGIEPRPIQHVNQLYSNQGTTGYSQPKANRGSLQMQNQGPYIYQSRQIRNDASWSQYLPNTQVNFNPFRSETYRQNQMQYLGFPVQHSRVYGSLIAPQSNPLSSNYQQNQGNLVRLTSGLPVQKDQINNSDVTRYLNVDLQRLPPTALQRPSSSPYIPTQEVMELPNIHNIFSPGPNNITMENTISRPSLSQPSENVDNLLNRTDLFGNFRDINFPDNFFGEDRMEMEKSNTEDITINERRRNEDRNIRPAQRPAGKINRYVFRDLNSIPKDKSYF